MEGQTLAELAKQMLEKKEQMDNSIEYASDAIYAYVALAHLVAKDSLSLADAIEIVKDPVARGKYEAKVKEIFENSAKESESEISVIVQKISSISDR